MLQPVPQDVNRLVEAEKAQVSAENKAFIVEKIATILRENYLFPEPARELADHVTGRWEGGAYSEPLSKRAFVHVLNADLRSGYADKHLYLSLGSEVAVTRERMAERRRHLSETNYGFNKIEKLPGNTGYLELTEFCPPEEARESMKRAFESLAGSTALVIDLRNNKGGAGDLVVLMCGRFFNKPTHLYDIVDPRTGEVQETSTSTEADDLKMADTPVTF